jgi:hypothetical protein
LPPLMLLDVDGVLNAFEWDTEELSDVWSHGFARAQGQLWPITFSPDIVGTLRAWHEQGRVEVQWLTTWGHAANETLRELLGLPHLQVAGTYDDELADGDAADDEFSLAGATPSAPDALSGSWWKYDVVRRVLREQPGRRVVWVDDELTDDSEFTAWARRQPGLLAIGPDPRRGLTTDDLQTIDRWLLEDGTSCAACGDRLVPVVYGYPAPGTVQAAERGDVVIGGCGVWDGQPELACASCR